MGQTVDRRRVECPKCHEGYQIPVDQSSQNLLCRQCGNSFRMPPDTQIGLAKATVRAPELKPPPLPAIPSNPSVPPDDPDQPVLMDWQPQSDMDVLRAIYEAQRIHVGWLAAIYHETQRIRWHVVLWSVLGMIGLILAVLAALVPGR